MCAKHKFRDNFILAEIVDPKVVVHIKQECSVIKLQGARDVASLHAWHPSIVCGEGV